jgi:1-acyl-sn-glycerol-3-phosphate acyltransferase
MRGLSALLFNFAFFAWTVLILVVGLPVLALPRDGAYGLGTLWAGVSLRLLKLIVGLDHRVLGLRNLPEGPALFAVKHQSAWDTLVFPLLLKKPAYVVKRELTLIPLFGWYLLRAEMIPVDRKGGAAALKSIVRRARDLSGRGFPILIYPEGTRVAPGDHRPYQPGIAALYSQLGLPVVPVALNSGLFWGRRSFLKHPGTITVEFLEPIAPGMPKRAFMALLEERIETAANRLASMRRGLCG